MNYSQSIRRREFLKAGAFGGLVLPGLFDTPQIMAAPVLRGEFSCIEILLSGGASHIDLWDPKPDAPADIRGEFSAIATAVPGLIISELLPKTAQIADRLTIVRNMTHREIDHAQAERVVSCQLSVVGSMTHVIEISGPSLGESLREARRLLDSGKRIVRVRFGYWDTHRRNAWCLKEILAPEFDRSFAALITDLAERGLLDSTRVVVTTEFGRSPRINRLAGRDHWPDAFSVVMAGPKMGGGQVIGSTDRYGMFVSDQPITINSRPRPATG